MKSYLDINSKVWELVNNKLQKNNITPLIIDVGARNDMFLLPDNYSRVSKLTGFEPNLIEYQKLVDNNTDAQKIFGIPKFKEKQYFNLALWNKNCKRDFFETVGPGASTLMGESNETSEKMFLIGSKLSFKEEHTGIEKVKKINCKKLDNLFKNKTIDFLKLDTEGSELPILEGGSNILRRKNILMIKCEFVFFKFYKEHFILGELHNFLSNLGYRLISIDLDQPKYSPRKSSIPNINDKGMSYSGDAYFCIDFSKIKINESDSLRMGAISLALGFNNLGLFFLEKSKNFSTIELMTIENYLSNVSKLRLLANFWKKIPAMLFNFFKR